MHKQGDLQERIEAKTIIRILQPQMAQHAIVALAQNPQLAPFILQYQGQVYFSLGHIEDPLRRKQTYQQLLALQMGQDIFVSRLPQPFPELLLPRYPERGTLMRAYFYGIIVGIISGIMAMAVTALIITIGGFNAETNIGLGLSAVSFIVFVTLGSVGAGIIISKRPQISRKQV